MSAESPASTSPFAQLANLDAFEAANTGLQEAAIWGAEQHKEISSPRPHKESYAGSSGSEEKAPLQNDLEAGFWCDVGTPGGSPTSTNVSAAAEFINWDLCLAEFKRSTATRASALRPAARPAPALAKSCRLTATSNQVLLPWDSD